MTAPYYRFEEPLRVQCKHFLDCVRSGDTPKTDGQDGLRVVQILEAADHSLKRNGQRVKLNYETNEISEAQ